MIRLLVLHRACEKPLYGVQIIEEMNQGGYTLSPGTLYPLLHSLEKKGYVRSHEERHGKRSRRVYAITAEGRKAVAGAKNRSKISLEVFLRTDDNACRESTVIKSYVELAQMLVPIAAEPQAFQITNQKSDNPQSPLQSAR